MSSELETRIGQLERLHDLARNRVESLSSTLEYAKRIGPGTFLFLDANRIEAELAEARSKFAEVREELEAAWAQRRGGAKK